jgi:thioredoxin-related protein
MKKTKIMIEFEGVCEVKLYGIRKTNPAITMFKKTIPLLSILALCLNTVMAKPVTEGAEPGQWTQDYEAALKVAAEKNLSLMLNFTGSDWCGWCKLMDKSVFAEDEWSAYAKKNLMLVTLDFPRDKSIVPAKWVSRNNELKGKFGVRGYPTYIVIDKDGETKLGQLGASRGATPKDFIAKTDDVIFFSESALATFAKSIPEGKAKDFDALMARRGKALKQLDKANEELTVAKKPLGEWKKTRPKKNAENDKIFAGFQKDIAPAAKKVEEAKKKVAAANDKIKAFK